MKNKLILLLLVIVALTITLTACGQEKSTNPLDGDDAKAAYDYICEKMNALDGFEADMIEASTYGGETESMEMDVKLSRQGGKKAFISTKLDDAGSFMDMTYIDGMVYCYVKSSGMEMKYKSTDASLTSGFDDIFASFEEDDEEVVSVTFGSRENGVYVLNAVATEETVLEIVMEKYEGYEMEASDFSNLSLTITMECGADGYVTKMIQTLTYTVEGESYTETSTCTYKNIGTVPEISAPADADSYMNMDEME